MKYYFRWRVLPEKRYMKKFILMVLAASALLGGFSAADTSHSTVTSVKQKAQKHKAHKAAKHKAAKRSHHSV